jgi:hypothetical protein
MPQLRRLAIAMAVLAMAVLAMAGCVGRSTSSRPAAGSTNQGPSSATSAAQDTRTAIAVLTTAGLTLPAGAEAVLVSAIPRAPFTDRYLVNFTAAARDVAAICTAPGLNGPSARRLLEADEQKLFSMSTPPPDGRGCRGSNPSDPRRQRDVLFTGDPATVWIAVWRAPAR